MAIAPILLLQKSFRSTGRLPRRSFGPPRNDMRFLKVHRNAKLQVILLVLLPNEQMQIAVKHRLRLCPEELRNGIPIRNGIKQSLEGGFRLMEGILVNGGKHGTVP